MVAMKCIRRTIFTRHKRMHSSLWSTITIRKGTPQQIAARDCFKKICLTMNEARRPLPASLFFFFDAWPTYQVLCLSLSPVKYGAICLCLTWPQCQCAYVSQISERQEESQVSSIIRAVRPAFVQYYFISTCRPCPLQTSK